MAHWCGIPLQSTEMDMWNAKIIVKKPNGNIAQLFDVSSLDEAHVNKQVQLLRDRWPVGYTIDMSQVEAARAAMARAA